MNILAIDPGSKLSAWMLLVNGHPNAWGMVPNAELRGKLISQNVFGIALVIESMVSYGQVVGEEVFETCRWIGRFEECWAREGGHVTFLRRQDIKTHITGSANAKDSGVREALIHRFGGPDIAVGGKKCDPCKGKGETGPKKLRARCGACSGSGLTTPRGPLYGITSDVWSALAIGLTHHDRKGA